MKSKIFTFLTLFTLFFGSLFIANSVVQTATAAVGNVSSSVMPGDNYYFNVASFPTFQELLDLAGQPDGVVMTATGGLATSEIYLKVISVQDETQTYFDGSNDITSSSVPTVDFTAGMITGEAIGLSVKNATTNAQIAAATLPAGSGLPLPAVLGTGTYFNISQYDGGAFLPVPFVLNDDWTTHAAVINVVKSMLENDPSNSMTLTNDGVQFKIDFNLHKLGDENSTVGLRGSASWAKDTGLVNQVVATFFNATTNVDFASTIDITLNSAKTENVPVLVEVGDTFDIKVSDAGFDFTTSGFNPDDNPTDEMTAIQSQMDALIGETFVSMEVVETHGMYYRITGSLRVNETYNEPIPGGDGEAWMVGFGRLGPGAMMNMAFNDNGGDDYYYDPYYALGLNSITQAERRVYSAPGFVVSADWDIYAAWDKTVAFAASFGLTTFLEVLQNIEEDADFWIASSTDDTPDITAVWNGGVNANGGYTTAFTVTADFVQYENRTEDNGGYWEDYYTYVQNPDTWHSNLVKVQGTVGLDSTHTKDGDLDYFKATADFRIEVYEEWSEWDGTVTTHGPVVVNIENGVVEFDATMTRVNPIVSTTTTEPTSGSTTSGGSSSDAPALDLPGFEFYLSIMSFIAVAFISKKRR
jgi:hypothetical protein